MNLPEDWTEEFMADGQRSVLCMPPGGGMVTINWVRRGFALGYGSHVHDRASPTLVGRGWRDRLKEAAIAALTDVYKDEK